MGLFEFVEDMEKEEEDKRKKELIEECKAYALEDWQIKLVLEGKYNPWDFDEDGELVEDDYYYEDDEGNVNSNNDENEENDETF